MDDTQKKLKTFYSWNSEHELLIAISASWKLTLHLTDYTYLLSMSYFTAMSALCEVNLHKTAYTVQLY